MKLFFLLLLFFPLGLAAQNKQEIHQQLYWLRYYLQVGISPKITWHSQFDERKFIGSDYQNQFITHQHLQYKANHWLELAPSITFSLQSSQTNQKTSLVIPEIRPAQSIFLEQKISSKIILLHRYQFEQRFIRKNDGINLLDGYNFTFRARYRFQFLWHISPKLNFKIQEELMAHWSKTIVYNVFDQNRVYVGLEYHFLKDFSLEVGYLKIFQQRPVGNEYFNRDIIRVSFYQKWKWYKDKEKQTD